LKSALRGNVRGVSWCVPENYFTFLLAIVVVRRFFPRRANYVELIIKIPKLSDGFCIFAPGPVIGKILAVEAQSFQISVAAFVCKIPQFFCNIFVLHYRDCTLSV
jgi:hypothetical protein